MSDISLIDSPIKQHLTYAVWSEDIIVGRKGIKREATVIENIFVSTFNREIGRQFPTKRLYLSRFSKSLIMACF